MQVGSRYKLQSMHLSSNRMHRHAKTKKAARKKEVCISEDVRISPVLIDLRETYLAKVEERLQRMERAMAKSGLELNGETLRRTSDEINHQGGIQDKLSMLKVSSKGRTAFVGKFTGPLKSLQYSCDT